MSSMSSEWKNPSDIMKIHSVQHQALVKLRKTKLTSRTDIVRRHSFNGLSQDRENSQNPVLQHSFCDTSVHSQHAGSQKRRNPFECDKTLSGHGKRRFMLDQRIVTNDLSPSAVGETINFVSDDCSAHEISDKDTSSMMESNQHRLLHVLNMQEMKASDTNLNRQENEEPQITRPDVLREMPVSLNIETKNSEVYSGPPLDWSLKTKMRVVVHSSECSLRKYPGIDAKNVDSYIHHKLDNSQEWKDLDILQQIRRCCFHYSYPHLPWISTFPRLSSDFKSRFPSVIAASKEVMESLQKDWTTTFTSVYQQLRGGLCPYFYVCTHQFTVLFRCLRSPTSSSCSALLSPSTRGLREMLTKEGIDFRMPNIRAAKSGKQKEDEFLESSKVRTSLSGHISEGAVSKSSQKEISSRNVTDGSVMNDEFSDEDNDIDGDDKASLWLEDMGLNKRDFPSLEPLKVKLQREGFRELDNRPQSMVYVEGMDVHSFFNFLLNYPVCIASSGLQHGIPPTILSPVSFVGGRLLQNVWILLIQCIYCPQDPSSKTCATELVKHTTLSGGLSCVAKQPGSTENKTTHVFEISGPVLPHHILNICSILQSGVHCESSFMSCSTHSPSAAFNTKCVNSIEKDKLASGLSKLFVEFSQGNHGLLHEVKDQLLASPVLEAGTAVREIQIVKSGYSWTC